MTTVAIDFTHDPELKSWVESANSPDTDFPIQNLPFGRFRSTSTAPWRVGVAIGDQILDLAYKAPDADMKRVMSLPSHARTALRQELSRDLAYGGPRAAELKAALVPQAEVEVGLPCEIRDYTDFYTSIHHATTVGKMFRPDSPLMPNYKWVPIAYHGRASSISASGHSFHRPVGQSITMGSTIPEIGPTKKLDYELELGFFISLGNEVGTRISMEMAEEHIFGVALFNDWSARDIQAWEYQPLGPFLSKSFASTISPWIVSLDALAPFRAPQVRPSDDPQPLPYLDSEKNKKMGAIDIELEVWIQTSVMAKSGQPAELLTRSNATDAYWTVAQLVSHHTINGCNLSTGDLLGSGTLSGKATSQAGSLLELTMNGSRPVVLGNGEQRAWLEDGDTVIFRAQCRRDGYRRIGLGECRATVLSAVPL
ncbi:fumarylacetoacetase [Robbsia andropogonis]|uniref:fumarylacetoacetase n=1 Tax=Robbsia andropogonis TaxID=28092 RepID=UPI0004653F73|nr:fumarylacetoacetase [Robbsia andropogonis]MCP1117885.1 fumarylacetoacetase [Robbsia andropogonis]MCP1127349.1 fumarylacetoacetase [Robbsia andropogonis]